MSEKVEVKTQGRTFLRSVNHVRVRETRGNYLRSVLVGLQFGVVHFSGEVLTVVLMPMLSDIITALYTAVSNLIFVVSGAAKAIALGFGGYLEASDEALEDEEDQL